MWHRQMEVANPIVTSSIYGTPEEYRKRKVALISGKLRSLFHATLADLFNLGITGQDGSVPILKQDPD